MKRLITILLATLFITPVAASAQTRRRASPRPPATSARSTVVRNQGATRVGEQIKNLTRFIYLLGGLSKGIEAMDDAVRRNQASPGLVQQSQQNKEVIRSSIRNVREGLDKLEIDFRATSELQPYYIALAGSAAGAATAEQQAANNQFDAAGRSLLGVVNRLTDVLLAMGTKVY